MYHKMNIAGLERKLPLCAIDEDLYIAAFIMFGDVEVTVAAAGELLKRVPEFDIIITAESKGIPLAYEIAKQAGNKDYIVARKAAKLYMPDVISTDVNSITTDHVQTLCIGTDDARKLTGKRVLIVDDVISTGESIKSLEILLEQVDCEIVGKATVLAEGGAKDRDDIVYLEALPLFNKNGEVKKATDSTF